jgi:putative transposase
MDSSPNAALITNAFGMAINSRGDVTGTVIHRDHGTQFGSWVFIERAKASGLVPSMGSIGDC